MAARTPARTKQAAKRATRTPTTRRAARAPKRPASTTPATGDASRQIDARIRDLGDWRGKTLARVRALIHEADPAVVEEWKWAKASSPGTPVWSHDGILCTGEAYKSVVKLTFAKGASLDDPARLFNSSLDGNVRRAIDLAEGDTLDERAFVKLIRAAVAKNLEKPARRRG